MQKPARKSLNQPVDGGAAILRQARGDLRLRGGELGQDDGDEDADEPEAHDKGKDQAHGPP